ncbi:MAG: (2Fe-2S)-binding protein [Acidimicrobiales bacterium]
MSQQQKPGSDPTPRSLDLTVNGEAVEVPDAGETLLAVLRDRLGLTSAKDGCSPQGQCGCCTVLVDGSPRVACVTPARRVRGRDIVTLEGLDEQRRRRWGDAFCAAGASQCGFCTPGIVMRLDALNQSLDAATPGPAAEPAPEIQPPAPETQPPDDDQAESEHRHKGAVDQALLAHLCRCTGWQTIHEAWQLFVDREGSTDASELGSDRDLDAAAARA